MRKLTFLTALSLLVPIGAHAANYPDWSSNGPALIGAKNGIAPLDSNGNFSGKTVGDISNSTIRRSDASEAPISTFFIPTAQSLADLSNLGGVNLSTGPLATLLANSASGSVLNFGDSFFPYANGTRVPHVKDTNFFMNFLGRVNRYASGSTFGWPGSFIADDSVIAGFWPSGAYGDGVHGSLSYAKYIPKTYDSSGNVISGAVADSIQDYAPVMHISEEVADQYKTASWGGRNDVGALVVELTEDSGSAASGVPIIASLKTNGTGGYFANSVALKTYTTNYGINSSWGIDTRIEDHSGLEPHNDGVSGGGYNIVGNEIDVQTYGQDNPNIQYVPFGYRAGLHMGFGLSGTDEASYGENVCAYHVGDRVLMPEYNTDGTAVLDPWGNNIRGVFKVKTVGGTCSSGMGKTGSIAASSWIRGSGASQMWVKGTDGIYSLVSSSIPSITSGDTVFVWGEDEPTTVGSVFRFEGSSIENNYSKGDYGGAQVGTGLFLSGAYLDTGIDLSSMECGVAQSDIVGGKKSSVPRTSCAAIRMPKDLGIDFSSTYDFHGSTNLKDSVSTQNNRVLKYNSGSSALSYFVNGTSMFSVKDTGDVSFSKVTLAQSGLVVANSSTYLSNAWNPSGDLMASGQSITGNSSSTVNQMAWSVFNEGTDSSGYSWYETSPYSSPHLINVMHLSGVGLTVNVKSSLDKGAITTDGSGNLTVKSLISSSLTYSALPTTASVGQSLYCSDCYSKLREDGDTQTGVLVFWNGSRWNDVLGLAIQH